jgi:hypothetical protein
MDFVIIMEMMKSPKLCAALEAALALDDGPQVAAGVGSVSSRTPPNDAHAGSASDQARSSMSVHHQGCPALVQKAMPFGR